MGGPLVYVSDPGAGQQRLYPVGASGPTGDRRDNCASARYVECAARSVEAVQIRIKAFATS